MQVRRRASSGSRRRTTWPRSSLSAGSSSRRRGGTRRPVPLPQGEDARASTSRRRRGSTTASAAGPSGDVIGFVTKHDKVSFGGALEALARRAGLDLVALMEERPRVSAGHAARGPHAASNGNGEGRRPRARPSMARRQRRARLLARVIDHYHRTFCEREDAQAYLKERGITDADLWGAAQIGYADGSLLKTIPKAGELRDELLALGVITAEGRELLGGCIVVPIPDPLTGQWTNLYGRGLKTPRHCYLPGPLRGVVNFQAARSSDEVVLTESIFDALSFHQAGVAIAIPLYGTNGFTPDHLDLLKREEVKRVILALDNDEPGRKATDALKEKLEAAGIAVRVASFPAGIRTRTSSSSRATAMRAEAFRAGPRRGRATTAACTTPAADRLRLLRSSSSGAGPPLGRSEPPPIGARRSRARASRYHARVHSLLLGRLRATVKATRARPSTWTRSTSTRRGAAASLRSARARRSASRPTRSRRRSWRSSSKPRRRPRRQAAEAQPHGAGDEREPSAPRRSASSAGDLLDQAARDIDALGYVGEETNKRLLYLVAVSRKLEDPLSAIVLSQSGAGKSGLTEVIERLCAARGRRAPDAAHAAEPLLHRARLPRPQARDRRGALRLDGGRLLDPRAAEPEEAHRRGPVKDPQTGNMRTKVFTVEARAAFIEATTASSVNHENATRCFELMMDETEEQTRRIHERQRLLRTERGLELRREAEAIARRHWNAQRLLEPLPVVIPFADKLSFPSSWMRTRRDHARFLNLIEVSAFLHQHQRETAAGGAIVASLADYAIAYALAGEVLRETLSDLKKPLREALQRIQGLATKGEDSVTPPRDPRGARRAGLDGAALARRARRARVPGRPRQRRAAPGKTTRYRLHRREPQRNVVARPPDAPRSCGR